MKEITSKQNYLYNGKIISVRCDDIVQEDGRKAKREVVEHRGGVCIVPVDNEGNVIVAAGGASVEDGVITGSMNYLVKGVEEV